MDADLLAGRIALRLRQKQMSERQACLLADLKPDFIRSIRRGHPPLLSKLAQLAKVLEISVSELIETAVDVRLDGVTDARSKAYQFPAVSPPAELATGVPPPKFGGKAPDVAFVVIRGLSEDYQLAEGGFSRSRADGPRAFPSRVVHDDLQGAATDFLWAVIGGSAMAPSLLDGDEVLINKRLGQPVQPGIFVVDEGIGPVPKWLEYVPASAPRRYRLRAEDQRFEAYELAAEQITIIGRIVWVGRRI